MGESVVFFDTFLKNIMNQQDSNYSSFSFFLKFIEYYLLH